MKQFKKKIAGSSKNGLKFSNYPLFLNLPFIYLNPKKYFQIINKQNKYMYDARENIYD